MTLYDTAMKMVEALEKAKAMIPIAEHFGNASFKEEYNTVSEALAIAPGFLEQCRDSEKCGTGAGCCHMAATIETLETERDIYREGFRKADEVCTVYAKHVYTIAPSPINSDITASVEEPFQFESRDEVLEFIVGKPNVLSLYKSLPALIESVFGKTKIHLSVFKDYEENWSNLRVKIESDHEIEKLSALEDQLFKFLEKDKSFAAALDHITISCGYARGGTGLQPIPECVAAYKLLKGSAD